MLWNATPSCRDEKRPSYCRRFQSAVKGLSPLSRHGSYTLVFDRAAANLPLTHKERSNDPCEYPKITYSASYLSASPPGRCQRAAGRRRDGKKESRSRQIKKKGKGRTGRNGFSSLYYRGLSPYFHSDPHVDRHTTHPAHYPPPPSPCCYLSHPLLHTRSKCSAQCPTDVLPSSKRRDYCTCFQKWKEKKNSHSIPRWSQKMGRSLTSECLLK